MTRNMGGIDRGLRILVALVLLYAAFATEFAAAGAIHWIAIAVAAVFTVTALIGNCPLYSVIGVKTCRAR